MKHSKFNKDEVIWGKVKGYPNWPGIIIEVIGEEKYGVLFFGDHTRSNLTEESIEKFEENFDKNFKNTKIKNSLYEALDYFVSNIIILFDLATNSVIASGESGAFASFARS